MEEFNDIWDKAPKFPEASSEERIDVDSFVQVYRDIDDLFEDFDEDETEEPPVEPEKEAVAVSAPEEEEDKTLEDELETIFETISDKNGLLSKNNLEEWDEITKLLQEGLLGQDEFEDIWGKTKKSPGDEGKLDVDGFLSFNVALDSLFEFEDDDMEELAEEALADAETQTAMEIKAASEVEAASAVEPQQPTSASKGSVEEGDMSTDQLFAALANEKGLVTWKDLSRWSDLQEMLKEGELMRSELDDIFLSSASQETKALDKEAFETLYNAIDDIFEDDDEDEEEDEPVAASSPAQASETKSTLLRFIANINSDEERLPCGLEASEVEQGTVLSIVNELEGEPTNIILERKGDVDMYDIAGDWDLIYSSSSAMKFNKGLSGLGGSLPNGKFAGVQQKLVATKFLTDVEYIEHIEVTPSSASFDVRVTGDWGLRESTSLFTGEPSVVMQVTPERVEYGPTSTRADHWKSLGPLNMLDIAYLDDDLRIMRGSTSVDTIFIFRRSQ